MTITETPTIEHDTIRQNTTEQRTTNLDAIPELAEHWKRLDLAEILRRPAAFVSVSQSNSLYKPGGVQYGERHDLRGSLEATVRVAKAARTRENFVSFNWVGYSLFRHDYPQTEFDRVQYASWVEDHDATPEQIAWDDALVPELRELVEPGDLEVYEQGLQCAFVGTELPLHLVRKRVEAIVFTGIHLDWCVEGNVRAARDAGYLPIVIGDATAAHRPETEAASFQRINQFFAPVISSHRFLELLAEGAN